MGAGGSAQAEYERRREREREARRRSRKIDVCILIATPFVVFGVVQLAAGRAAAWYANRFIDETGASPRSPEDLVDPSTARVIGLILAMTATAAVASALWGPKASTEAWGKGAEGERATGRALDSLPDGWTVRHDLKMPGSRANIDHLVVGPTGVFTVETKNYAAGVTIRGGRAKSNGRSMDKAIAQAKGQAEAMSKVFSVDATPIICVQGGALTVGWLDKAIVDGVRFASGRGLVKAITGRPRVFTDEQVAALLTQPSAQARQARDRGQPSNPPKRTNR